MQMTEPQIETYESFEAMKEQVRQRKLERKKNAMERLDAHKVQYVVRNNGTHVIITEGSVRLHFWPTTGKWRQDGVDRTRHGVTPLIGVILGLRDAS
jgi:hypothetical protein